jgi:hypothetical protein
MKKQLLAVLTVGLVTGLVASAGAREPGVVTPDDLYAALGSAVSADQLAALTDISAEFEGAFSLPTEVYTGGVYVDFDGSQLSFNIDNYVQDGVIRGIDLFYYPEEVEFAALPFEEQQAVYDLIYWHLVERYAGEDGGISSYYDETGGLYTYEDGDGWLWTLRWRAGGELVLSLDDPAFYDEHYVSTVLRSAGAK